MNIPTRVISAALLTIVMAAPGVSRADAAGVQFAAEMVQIAPDGQSVGGKLFVGDGRTRMEMSNQGRDLVRIVDRKRGLEWLLFPTEQAYLEHAIPVESAPPSAETNPCAAMPSLSCRRVGIEDLSGRPAVKWEMSMTNQGQTLTETQWLDVQRGLVVKDVLPNGQTMELKLLGSETVGGRAAEKWELTTMLPNQPPVRGVQWYDPELRLAVRQEFPGGYVRELRNIHIGAQPEALFALPTGYAKKTAPPAGPAQPDGQ